MYRRNIDFGSGQRRKKYVARVPQTQLEYQADSLDKEIMLQVMEWFYDYSVVHLKTSRYLYELRWQLLEHNPERVVEPEQFIVSGKLQGDFQSQTIENIHAAEILAVGAALIGATEEPRVPVFFTEEGPEGTWTYQLEATVLQIFI